MDSHSYVQKELFPEELLDPTLDGPDAFSTGTQLGANLDVQDPHESVDAFLERVGQQLGNSEEVVYSFNMVADKGVLQAFYTPYKDHLGKVADCLQDRFESGEWEDFTLLLHGSPGTGKTCGLNYVLNTLEKNDHQFCTCDINAMNTENWSAGEVERYIYTEMRTALGMSDVSHKASVRGMLTKAKQCGPILVKVEEIDQWLQPPAKFQCMQQLLQWANNPKHAVALIGLSNRNDEASIVMPQA